MSSKRHVTWGAPERARLEAMIAQANGRRGARVLSLAQVDACIDEALQAERGFAWRHGGGGADARALTSICLAVLRDEQLTVGVASAHGVATPASAWADLERWDTWESTANRAAVLAWAGRRRDDRVRVPTVARAEVRATREALLAAVRAAPDDDGPRLVYADVLTEAGDPRGEFISVQCALPTATDDARVELERRQAELLERHGRAWARGTTDVVRVRFERGFVAEVTLTDLEVLPALTELAAHEPLVELTLRVDRRVDADALGAAAWVEQLRTLRCLRETRGHVMDSSAEPLARLLDAERWRQLERLVLRGQAIGDEGLALLAERGPRVLPRLVELCVERDRLTGAGVSALLASRWVTQLTGLGLDDNELENAGAAVLATSVRLGRLQHLDLGHNRISVAGLEALLGTSTLGGLQTLELGGNPLGASGRERWRARFPPR